MEYSKKQINPLIEKYGIDPSKDKKFIEIIELFGNQTNYQIWAIKSIYTKVITMPELRQIKDWASQNSTEIKNLLKENIISYKTREEIRQLFSEFEGLKRIKIVKTAINKFNTDQRKMLTNYLLADMKNGLDAMHSRKMQLVDTFCFFSRGELWVKNMHIAEYFYGSYNNHTARRDRKLLLTKKELRKLQRTSDEPGFTIVPTRMYINERGLAKVVIALAKGKKQYDKRQTLKEKEDRRMMDRMFKR